MNKTKNDAAWEALFKTYSILEKVNEHGFFKIDSAHINKFRESRLMAKFDHCVNLPVIFRDNHLSILPISRSKYIIARFDTHFNVNYSDEVEAIPFEFPAHIESTDYTNLYSESSALNCAFNTGIISNLIDEEAAYTISGRMSTKTFDFEIKSSTGDETLSINVNKSQCEIDGGFESKNYLLLVEAKNYAVDDFLIRQLYYPYRLWLARTGKKVLSVLMTYSYDMFSFFMYEFKDKLNYNSLALVEQKNYVIAPEEILLNDVSNIFNELRLVSEPQVPFPQADKFERVVDLLSLLVEKDLTKNEITGNYQFNVRQTQYYTDAGRYIGLIDKYKNPLTKEVTFCLTDEGKSTLKKRYKVKYLALIKKVLEHRVLYAVFELALNKGEIPLKNEICEVMVNNGLGIKNTTTTRRSQTFRGWLEWIWLQIE